MPKKTIYAKEYRELVDGLRRIRKDLGLTQVALAEALGWPQQRLSAVESGSRRLDVMEYFVLADKLGLPPDRALALILALLYLQPASWTRPPNEMDSSAK